MDLDGDGVLSLFEMVYFYEEVLQRLQELNIDCLSVENTVCQILDMVNPKNRGKLLSERRCGHRCPFVGPLCGLTRTSSSVVRTLAQQERFTCPRVSQLVHTIVGKLCITV